MRSIRYTVFTLFAFSWLFVPGLAQSGSKDARSSAPGHPAGEVGQAPGGTTPSVAPCDAASVLADHIDWALNQRQGLGTYRFPFTLMLMDPTLGSGNVVFGDGPGTPSTLQAYPQFVGGDQIFPAGLRTGPETPVRWYHAFRRFACQAGEFAVNPFDPHNFDQTTIQFSLPVSALGAPSLTIRVGGAGGQLRLTVSQLQCNNGILYGFDDQFGMLIAVLIQRSFTPF